MTGESVKTPKIFGDIEYRVIGNAFGLMISTAGLLGGAMLNQRSFEYWMDDLVPLMLSARWPSGLRPRKTMLLRKINDQLKVFYDRA